MFITENELNNLSKTISVVIVGTGPAGISTALELESLGVKCLLIEAGGYDFPSEEGLDPYKANITGRPYALQASRLRFFGGTSGHWGGWCKPLDPEDFSNDKSIFEQWPISHSEAYKYLRKAEAILDIDSSIGYDGSNIPSDTILDTTRDKKFRTSNFLFSTPTRFGKKYKKIIYHSKYIHCLLDTSLVFIGRDKDNLSTKLLVKLPSGKRKEIYGRSFVLAMGGVENARYLLASNLNIENKYGSDLIGRCFMDHFGFKTSLVYSKKGLVYRTYKINNNKIRAVISPSESMLARGLNNVMLGLFPVSKDNSLISKEYIKNIGLFDSSVSNTDGYLYELRTTSANSPTKKSYVSIGDEVDINGVNRAILNWHIPDEDFKSVIDTVELFAHSLGSLGFGRLKRVKHHIPSQIERLSTGMHHIGTTRMATKPKYGVVDENLKCFNSKNLFIAGSSVFPTAGYANPTLTIVCLSIRLANHIHNELKKGNI